MDRRQLYIAAGGLGLTSGEILQLSEIFHLYSKDKELFLLQGEKIFQGKTAAKKIHGDWEGTLDSIYKKVDVLNIGILTIEDSEYPEELRLIENPPAVLYYRGDLLHALSFERAGIVGSRKHTAYGKNICENIVDDLSDLGVVVVSGMALGLDGVAHKAALGRNIPTIAVLGSGVDVIYPKTHSRLYLNIIENGAVVSEYPPGSEPKAYHFPQRNRIISGLSRCIIVVEAKEKSGSLITARLAAEQGREVFAVPGNINSLYSRGTNRLIRDGAHPYLEKEDFLPFFSCSTSTTEDALWELSDEERDILKLIEEGTNTANLICLKTGDDITYINGILTILEMKGVISVEGADRFVPVRY